MDLNFLFNYFSEIYLEKILTLKTFLYNEFEESRSDWIRLLK